MSIEYEIRTDQKLILKTTHYANGILDIGGFKSPYGDTKFPGSLRNGTCQGQGTRFLLKISKHVQFNFLPLLYSMIMYSSHLLYFLPFKRNENKGKFTTLISRISFALLIW